MTEQCCGNCEHYNPVIVEESGEVGSCNAPLPDSVVENRMVKSTEGTTCPCYKEKKNG
jgi:hypothetical protein